MKNVVPITPQLQDELQPGEAVPVRSGVGPFAGMTSHNVEEAKEVLASLGKLQCLKYCKDQRIEYNSKVGCAVPVPITPAWKVFTDCARLGLSQISMHGVSLCFRPRILTAYTQRISFTNHLEMSLPGSHSD